MLSNLTTGLGSFWILRLMLSQISWPYPHFKLYVMLKRQYSASFLKIQGSMLDLWAMYKSVFITEKNHQIYLGHLVPGDTILRTGGRQAFVRPIKRQDASHIKHFWIIMGIYLLLQDFLHN